jgi:hypothetical protein
MYTYIHTYIHTYIQKMFENKIIVYSHEYICIALECTQNVAEDETIAIVENF